MSSSAELVAFVEHHNLLSKYCLDKNFFQMFSFSLELDQLDNAEKFCINLKDAQEWLGFSRKDPAKRLLTLHFEEDFDYKIFLHSSVEKSRGAPTEKIMLTVDCFKNFATKSETSIGKETRKYLWIMEKIATEFIKHQMFNQKKLIQAQNEELKKKDREIMLAKNRLSKYVYNPSERIYIFPVDIDGSMNRGDEIYKLGRAKNVKTRNSTYNTGRPNDVWFAFEKSCIDSKLCESVIKCIFRGYEYEPCREIYEIPLDIMKKHITEIANFVENTRYKFEEDMNGIEESSEEEYFEGMISVADEIRGINYIHQRFHHN